MNLVIQLKFFHVLTFSKIDREKVFADVLDIKEDFKDYKKSLYEKRESGNFLKGLVNGFHHQLKISSTLIFMQIKPRKGI